MNRTSNQPISTYKFDGWENIFQYNKTFSSESDCIEQNGIEHLESNGSDCNGKDEREEEERQESVVEDKCGKQLVANVGISDDNIPSNKYLKMSQCFFELLHTQNYLIYSRFELKMLPNGFK